MKFVMSKKMLVLVGLKIQGCQCKVMWLFRDCCTNPPVCLRGAALSGPPQCPRGCTYTLCSAEKYSHIQTCPACPHLCIWAYAPVQSGAGVVQLLFLLLDEQASQACLARSISSPRSVPPVLAGPTLPAASAQAGCGRQGALPLMLSNMWLPKPTGYALLVVFLAQHVLVQVNDLEDTTVLLPNPQLSGHPLTKPACVVVGVKNHSETLNVNVSAITMRSRSKRSWIFKVTADEKCMQEYTGCRFLESKGD